MAIGQKLEEARNRKGISIREASESTKIRGDYLTSFEAGQFEINLPDVYLRGFIKVYARYLGIDPESAVADLEAELGASSSRTKKKSLGSISPPEMSDKTETQRVAVSARPRNRTPNQSQSVFRKPIAIFTLGGGLLIVLLVIIIISTSEEQESVSQSLPSVEPTIRETATNLPNSNPTQSSVQLSNLHMLKLAAIGPIERLIVCDEGKSPKEFHEYKNLSLGWEIEIPFTSSFRCYSSMLENIRFAVDDGLEKQVSGKGAGNFRWQP
jgi:cytoskeletal protein RodZ